MYGAMSKVFALACCTTLTGWSLPSQAALPEEPRIFEAACENEKSAIKLQLTTQMLWKASRVDLGDETRTDTDLFFRRIRPVLRGHTQDNQLAFLLQTNLVPGSLELLDAYADFRFMPHAQTRIGQMKIPFTRWRMNSFKSRPSTDWSYPTRYFGAERQRGVLLHNGQDNPPVFEYEFGIFDGTNARASNGVGMALVYGAERPNPSDLTAWNGNNRPMHTEMVGHVAYNAERIDVRKPSDFRGGPLRWSVGMSAAWDLDPVAFQDMRLRLAPELDLKFYGFALHAVGYAGFFDPAFKKAISTLGLLGTMVQTSYAFAQYFEVAFGYAFVNITQTLRKDARSLQHFLLSDYSTAVSLDASNLKGTQVGKEKAKHELTIGFNVYAWSNALKYQIEGAWLVDEFLRENRHHVALCMQLQLAF